MRARKVIKNTLSFFFLGEADVPYIIHSPMTIGICGELIRQFRRKYQNRTILKTVLRGSTRAVLHLYSIRGEPEQYYT